MAGVLGATRPCVRDRWHLCAVFRMLYRFAGAVRRAAKEESFVAIVSAWVALVLTGTVVFTLGEGWRLVDGFYFAVCTLTTSSIADPISCSPMTC